MRANRNKTIEHFVRQQQDLSRQIVIVQGIGFVGTAMIAALCKAADTEGKPLFGVIGVDRLDENGKSSKIESVLNYVPPIDSTDQSIYDAYGFAKKEKNLFATSDRSVYQYADVVVIDINFDVAKARSASQPYKVSMDSFENSLQEVAEFIKPGSLVVLETTVPPGTTEKTLVPLFEAQFIKRGVCVQKVRAVHSYERVTPGKDYLSSITDYYRTFAAINKESAEQARQFFSSFINVDEYPLYELSTPTESEMAKVLENSFRSMNIAFIDEWTKYADLANVNLYNVIQAVKQRDTHKNIMLPGFGVGGYCLPKDSLLADWSLKNFFKSNESLSLSCKSIQINDDAPLFVLKKIQSLFGDLGKLRIALYGITYIADVADTRHSPSETFIRAAEKAGAKVYPIDPFIGYWQEMKRTVSNEIKDMPQDTNVLVLAVKHTALNALDIKLLVKQFPNLKGVVDANHVLTEKQALDLKHSNIDFYHLGH